MNECESNCQKISDNLIKINFFDKLAGRKIQEKSKNHCHIHCLKENKIRN